MHYYSALLIKHPCNLSKLEVAGFYFLGISTMDSLGIQFTSYSTFQTRVDALMLEMLVLPRS